MIGSREDAKTPRRMHACSSGLPQSEISNRILVAKNNCASRIALFASLRLRANKILGGYGQH